MSNIDPIQVTNWVNGRNIFFMNFLIKYVLISFQGGNWNIHLTFVMYCHYISEDYYIP